MSPASRCVEHGPCDGFAFANVVDEDPVRANRAAITKGVGQTVPHGLLEVEARRAAFGDGLHIARELDLRSYEDAVATYRDAIAREDADAASWLKLGNALALLEQYQDAAGAFRNALERAPELAAAFNGLGASLMHLGDAEQAALALDRAAELDARDPNPLMNLALLHERSGDAAAAREAWERALERDPSSSIAQRRLARL